MVAQTKGGAAFQDLCSQQVSEDSGQPLGFGEVAQGNVAEASEMYCLNELQTEGDCPVQHLLRTAGYTSWKGLGTLPHPAGNMQQFEGITGQRSILTATSFSAASC